MTAIFVDVGSGAFAVRLPAEIRRFLASLALGAVSNVAERHPATWRLFPPAYQDDPERESAYRELVGQELVDGRVASLELLTRTADAETLSADDLEGWMHALETLRLILGNPSEADADPADAERRMMTMDVLTHLQAAAVEALAPDLAGADG